MHVTRNTRSKTFILIILLLLDDRVYERVEGELKATMPYLAKAWVEYGEDGKIGVETRVYACYRTRKDEIP